MKVYRSLKHSSGGSSAHTHSLTSILPVCLFFSSPVSLIPPLRSFLFPRTFHLSLLHSPVTSSLSSSYFSFSNFLPYMWRERACFTFCLLFLLLLLFSFFILPPKKYANFDIIWFEFCQSVVHKNAQSKRVYKTLKHYRHRTNQMPEQQNKDTDQNKKWNSDINNKQY